jgi:hypothetical protein
MAGIYVVPGDLSGWVKRRFGKLNIFPTQRSTEHGFDEFRAGALQHG